MNDVFRKEKILIVDDEEDFSSTLKDRLLFSGYDVICASNGSLAVDLARDQKPDLVLLDIMMPLMNGHQCWSFFQKDSELKKIPILILTAKMHATDNFFRGRFPDGDYLSKGLSFKDILLKVAEKLQIVEESKRQSDLNL